MAPGLWAQLGHGNLRVSLRIQPRGAVLSLRVCLKRNFCSVLALGIKGGRRSPGKGLGFLCLKSESATGWFVDIVLQGAVEMVETDRGPQTKHSERMRINAHF